MGWTGAQYSLYRLVLAVFVAELCWDALAPLGGLAGVLRPLSLLAAAALALGWHDRAFALALFVIVTGLAALTQGAPLILPGPDLIAIALLLMLHVAVPARPYGALSARGRIDPRGGEGGPWSRPAWLGHTAWALLAVAQIFRVLERAGSLVAAAADAGLAVFSGIGCVLELGFAFGGLRPAWRRRIWIAIGLWRLGWLAAYGPKAGDAGFLLLYLFACEPGWWRGRSQQTRPADGANGERALLFYDGECGFCHRSVRFILAEEAASPDALRLRFAPLQGPTFAERLRRPGAPASDALPDSIVLALEDGRLLTRSAAAVEIAARLGGLWRGLATLARRLPSAPLDAGYDAIARIRKRLFAEPKESCPILPPDLRARFDP